MKADQVDKIAADIRAELMIFTEDKKVMTFSEPDRNGLRTIVANDGQKMQGFLWGSWDGPIPPEGERFRCEPETLRNCRAEIETGHNLILMRPVPSFPKLQVPLISGKPVVSIYVRRR